MIIGHLPIGYFTTKYLIKKLKLSLNSFWLIIGVISAIVPDLDYFYWIIINSQKSSHRGYFTSYPLFYLTLLIISVIVYFLIKKKWLKLAIIIVFINILIHFLLDTVFYGVKWFYPFYNEYIGIYNVGGFGKQQGIQVENYFNHWYWYLEIALWLMAVISVIKSSKKGEFK